MAGSPLDTPGIPGSEPPRAPRSPARLWVQLIVAAALVIVFALGALGGLTNAVGGHLHHGDTRGGEVAIAVVCLALLIVCTRWVLHVEHRLRRHQPVAQAYEARYMRPSAVATATASASPSARARASVRGRSGRGYGPVGTTVVLLLLIAGMGGGIAGTVVQRSEGERSTFVQNSGVRSTATVDNVANNEACGRYGCTYSAAIDVTLARPVGGARTTVVHYPNTSDLSDGETVAVLVDPKQPSYAELPGAPFQNNWTWIILAGLALVFLGLVILDARHLLRLLAHRRDHRATTAAGGLATAGP